MAQLRPQLLITASATEQRLARIELAPHRNELEPAVQTLPRHLTVCLNDLHPQILDLRSEELANQRTRRGAKPHDSSSKRKAKARHAHRCRPSPNERCCFLAATHCTSDLLDLRPFVFAALRFRVVSRVRWSGGSGEHLVYVVESRREIARLMLDGGRAILTLTGLTGEPVIIENASFIEVTD